MGQDETTMSVPSKKPTRHTRRDFLRVAGMGAAATATAGLVGEAFAGGLSPAAAANLGSAGLSAAGKKYYLVTGNIGDPFYIQVRAGFAAIDKLLGCSSTIVGTSNTDISVIVSDIATLIARKGTSGLMVPDLAANAYGPVYKQAAAAGVPILNYLNDGAGPRITFVGADESTQAQNAAQLLGAKLSGKGKVGFIAQLNQPDLVNKGKVFAAYIAANYPGMSYVGAQTYDGSPEGGLTTFQSVFTKHPDLAGMFWGDGSGGAIAQSIHSTAPNVALLLTDTVTASVAAVKAGYAFACNGPSQFDVAFYAPLMLFMWNLGFRVPDPCEIPIITVNSTNVAAYSADPYHHGAVNGVPNPSFA